MHLLFSTLIRSIFSALASVCIALLLGGQTRRVTYR